jgi:DNA-binding response OmpR family regulator
VILDDQAVVENERGWLLAQIRKHFSGISLLYVAANQSDGNEKRARTNGAHYYSSKPLSLEPVTCCDHFYRRRRSQYSPESRGLVEMVPGAGLEPARRLPSREF